MVRAYILIEAQIEAQVGHTGEVVNDVKNLEGVKAADSVAGPYDVVASVEVADLETLGKLIKKIHSLPGIAKTTSLIVVKY